jgi:Flp pilus assembly protein TadG
MQQMMRALRRRLGEPDRGSSAVELAILAPALIMMTMLIIQFAIWFDARHAALAAAQAGDRIAREEAASNPAWAADAQTEANNYFHALDTSVITLIGMPTATRMGGNEVAVTVTGKLNGVIPIPMTISVTVSGPVECFRTQVSNGQAC